MVKKLLNSFLIKMGLNCKISFKERAKLGMEQLAKQPPVTLEEARKQVQWLKEMSETNIKKQRETIIKLK